MKISAAAKQQQLATEFSPILAARTRQAKVQRIARNPKLSYKMRLAAMTACDTRPGQVWAVPTKVHDKALAVVQARKIEAELPTVTWDSEDNHLWVLV